MPAERNSYRVRATWLAIVTAIVVGGIVGPWRTNKSAWAQPPVISAPAATSAEEVKKAKEFGDILDALDDIDRLHALNPLKLTPDRLDKIIVLIPTMAADFNKKSAALGSAELLKMGDEIRATRKSALAGAQVPKEFDDRIIKLQTDITAQRVLMGKKNLLALSVALQSILTPAQVSQAAKLSKDVAKKLGQDSEGSDIQWFNSYVLDTFINNPRVVILLKSMRAAAPDPGIKQP